MRRVLTSPHHPFHCWSMCIKVCSRLTLGLYPKVGRVLINVDIPVSR